MAEVAPIEAGADQPLSLIRSNQAHSIEITDVSFELRLQIYSVTQVINQDDLQEYRRDVSRKL